MGHEFISDVLQPLSVFGGIALVIWASARAKLEHRKLDMMRGQPLPETRQAPTEDRVLAELKAMQQQMAEMQSTSHSFDLSFDEALNRLESRVSRIETKSAAATAAPATDATTPLRNGQSS